MNAAVKHRSRCPYLAGKPIVEPTRADCSRIVQCVIIACFVAMISDGFHMAPVLLLCVGTVYKISKLFIGVLRPATSRRRNHGTISRTPLVLPQQSP